MARPIGKRSEYFRIFVQPLLEDFIYFWKKKDKRKNKSNGCQYNVCVIGRYQTGLIPWVMNDVA